MYPPSPEDVTNHIQPNFPLPVVQVVESPSVQPVQPPPAPAPKPAKNSKKPTKKVAEKVSHFDTCQHVTCQKWRLYSRTMIRNRNIRTQLWLPLELNISVAKLHTNKLTNLSVNFLGIFSVHHEFSVHFQSLYGSFTYIKFTNPSGWSYEISVKILWEFCTKSDKNRSTFQTRCCSQKDMEEFRWRWIFVEISVQLPNTFRNSRTTFPIFHWNFRTTLWIFIEISDRCTLVFWLFRDCEITKWRCRSCKKKRRRLEIIATRPHSCHGIFSFRHKGDFLIFFG